MISGKWRDYWGLCALRRAISLVRIEMLAESEGFEPSVPVTQHGSLANCWFQPLTHDSGKQEAGYSQPIPHLQPYRPMPL